MERSILKLEKNGRNVSSNVFRTIFKTQHGRIIYLALEVNDRECKITDCFYADRNQGRSGTARFASTPLKLRTFRFSMDNLLSVLEAELDKKFYGIEYIQTDNADLSMDEYLKVKSNGRNRQYRFLIMVGDGNNIGGLPSSLCTRLKNKLHRSIFVELEYYKDGNGIVKQCFYYDRKYKRQGIHVMPPMLTSCFFPYNQDGILKLLNNEMCCDFTHMMVASGIDVNSNTTPLCGAL